MKLARANAQEMEELFTELVSASLKGFHFVLISKASLTWALDNLDLSSRHKAHLNYLKEIYPTTASIISEAKVMLEVIIGTQEIRHNEGSYSIGHTKFLNGAFGEQPSSLVLENGNTDNNFYSLIFKKVLTLSSIPSFRYIPINGGGQTSSIQFQAEIDRNNIVVCITDTDKYSPGDKGGGTYTAAKSVFERNENKFVGAFMPSIGREIENYIPYSILRNIRCYRDIRFEEEFQTIMVNSETEPNGAWHYFDIKAGLTGEKIIAMCKPSRGKSTFSVEPASWWLAKLGCNAEDLIHVDIRGFGNNVIQSFLNCGESISNFNSVCNTNEWQKIYLCYFEKVLWYFCSSPVKRL